MCLRQFVRAEHRRWVFRYALSKFATDPHRHHTDQQLLAYLNYGWGNEGWSTKSPYLMACLQAALSCTRPILECGSGLSTILLGIVARSTGTQVWALEHIPVWGRRVINCLREADVASAIVVIRPLREYGNFAWYDPPLDVLPRDFGLAVCDGPPGDTHGGRYGLLPIMRSRMAAGCLILLDDAERAQEEGIARRWAAELRGSVEILGGAHRYARLLVPELVAILRPNLHCGRER
jgi:hypothetical protein